MAKSIRTQTQGKGERRDVDTSFLALNPPRERESFAICPAFRVVARCLQKVTSRLTCPLSLYSLSLSLFIYLLLCVSRISI